MQLDYAYVRSSFYSVVVNLIKTAFLFLITTKPTFFFIKLHLQIQLQKP